MVDIEMKPDAGGEFSFGGPVRDEEKNWAMTCHLSAFAGYLLPFGNILGPLLVWLFKGKTSRFVAAQGKEAINFQVSVTLYFLGAWLLAAIGIGFLLMIAISIFDFVAIILATVKNRRGEPYRYPFCLRLIK
ncbi:DUF4870 domain-containing protein [Desulfuromonas sp.]|uniref:DUF4870 domain-containing protein n=1 Tax=Desulfuromonas sp. TaxID=892 RepID=UPI0025C29B65|nr:DUF4870 domain-containing protein [Desulfuromonas sp.]